MMFPRALGRFFSSDIAIDLGTANTLVYMSGKGIVLDEPSVVAMTQKNDGSSRTVHSVGKAAKSMLGRTPGNIEAIRPLKDGVIADFLVTEHMLKHFIRKVHQNSLFAPSPRIVICVPCGSTPVERRAIRESALAAGGRKIYLVEEPMAAAIGAGLPVNEAYCSMVVDIGGGTTEIGVISLGGLVYSNSIRVGGDRFDDAIVSFIRQRHDLYVGEGTAEIIKKDIGTAFPVAISRSLDIRGRSAKDGIPMSVTVTSEEILHAIDEPLRHIVRAIKGALEATPPELAADLVTSGIVLTGGGAMLNGLDRLIQEETKLPVRVADNALECVVRGCGLVVENLDLYANAVSG